MVTDFGTNRKLICDFLLVINTNLTSYLALFPRYSRPPRSSSGDCHVHSLYRLGPSSRVHVPHTVAVHHSLMQRAQSKPG